MKKLILTLLSIHFTIAVIAQVTPVAPPPGTKQATTNQGFIYKNGLGDTTRIFFRMGASGISTDYYELGSGSGSDSIVPLYMGRDTISLTGSPTLYNKLINIGATLPDTSYKVFVQLKQAPLGSFLADQWILNYSETQFYYFVYDLVGTSGDYIFDWIVYPPGYQGGAGGGGGGGSYVLPTASASVKGGVKIGAGLLMTGDVLSTTGGGGGSGTVTSVTSANSDIGVINTTTTPVLTLNSGFSSGQIPKFGAYPGGGGVAFNFDSGANSRILVNGTSREMNFDSGTSGLGAFKFTNNSNSIRLNMLANGNILFPSLASGTTTPTPSGTEHMITVDANGLFGHRTIPGGGGGGSVSSVDMSVPTGFSISGNPITTSGTLGLGFASGYSLPSNSTQSGWTAKQNAITLTTTGTSGASTFDGTTLNIPQYTGGGGGGSVTSVGLSAPTGFSVSGSPVTSSGTLGFSFASGYSLPTNSSQSSWDAKQGPITLTTTGTSGAATFDGTTINIPQYSGGVGSQDLQDVLAQGNTSTSTIDMRPSSGLGLSVSSGGSLPKTEVYNNLFYAATSTSTMNLTSNSLSFTDLASTYNQTIFTATPTAARTILIPDASGSFFVGLSGSASLNFPSTPAGSNSLLTITVGGAAVGDAVAGGSDLGIWGNYTFNYFVSSANTVSVLFCNNSASTVDLAAQTFKVRVFK